MYQMELDKLQQKKIPAFQNTAELLRSVSTAPPPPTLDSGRTTLIE